MALFLAFKTDYLKVLTLKVSVSQNPYQSEELLVWRDAQENQGSIQPYSLDELPIWGRDILTQLGITMKSPNEVVTAQMFKTGFIPG